MVSSRKGQTLINIGAVIAAFASPCSTDAPRVLTVKEKRAERVGRCTNGHEIHTGKSQYGSFHVIYAASQEG